MSRQATKSTRGVGSHDGLWDWQDVELSNGVVLRVRGMPPYLADAILAALPLPTPPLIEVPSELPGGGNTVREDLNNVQYKQDWTQQLINRDKVLSDAQLAWCIEFEPPSNTDWQDEILVYVPDIKWTGGPHGLKIDYLKYVIIRSMADLLKLKRVMGNIALPTEKEITAVEESFRDSS